MLHFFQVSNNLVHELYHVIVQLDNENKEGEFHQARQDNFTWGAGKGSGRRMEVAKNHYLEAKHLQLDHLPKDRFLSLQQLTNFLASIVLYYPGTTTGRMVSLLSQVYQVVLMCWIHVGSRSLLATHSRMLKPYHRWSIGKQIFSLPAELGNQRESKGIVEILSEA